jgi:hypothetical protein
MNCGADMMSRAWYSRFDVIYLDQIYISLDPDTVKKFFNNGPELAVALLDRLSEYSILG